MNVKQLLPKEQKELIIKALESYQHTLGITMDRHERMGNTINDSINHDVFDLTGLIGMMKYDVEIALPKIDKQNFAHLHGVDFPEYLGEVDRDYPIEEESEWITVMTGDFSFIDDNIHARECHVNRLLTVEKHPRRDEGEVIDAIESDGHGWVVIEDYDGHIIMNFDNNTKKDERRFQVVDVCGDYTHTVSHKELITEGGFDGHHDGHYRDAIDKLDAGETLEVHKEEVYLIRIK